MLQVSCNKRDNVQLAGCYRRNKSWQCDKDPTRSVGAHISKLNYWEFSFISLFLNILPHQDWCNPSYFHVRVLCNYNKTESIVSLPNNISIKNLDMKCHITLDGMRKNQRTAEFLTDLFSMWSLQVQQPFFWIWQSPTMTKINAATPPNTFRHIPTISGSS